MFNIIKDDLAAQGIELELIEMNDYVTPNLALADGAIDINSFQHIQYLNQFFHKFPPDVLNILECSNYSTIVVS